MARRERSILVLSKYSISPSPAIPRAARDAMVYTYFHMHASMRICDYEATRYRDEVIGHFFQRYVSCPKRIVMVSHYGKITNVVRRDYLLSLRGQLQYNSRRRLEDNLILKTKLFVNNFYVS